MNTINKIVKDTVPPKIELDRVSYEALWLDVSDEANPTLKVKSGNEYKETNGAASVSITVTDPQTGEPVTVTGLANVLNALAEMAGQGYSGDIILELPEPYSVGTSATFTGSYAEIAERCGITAEQVEKLFAGDYLAVAVTISLTPTTNVKVYAQAVFASNVEGNKSSQYSMSSGPAVVSIQCVGGVANELQVTVSLNEG